MAFFEDIPAIYDRLKRWTMSALDILKLGQSATTLSGGEAQRVKIAIGALSSAHHENYLPARRTDGRSALRRRAEAHRNTPEARERGNTVVVIEHNLDVMKSADHIIDIGPEGGVAAARSLRRHARRSLQDRWLAHWLLSQKVLKRGKK